MLSSTPPLLVTPPALLVLVVGCGARGADRFRPDSALAQAALVSALESWAHDKPRPDDVRLNGQLRRVAFVDQHRKPRQRLLEYSILGEQGGARVRCFVARLVCDLPQEEVTVRYYVVGVDPLWVFRQEDYDMLAHWDHPLPAPGKAIEAGRPVGESTNRSRGAREKGGPP